MASVLDEEDETRQKHNQTREFGGYRTRWGKKNEERENGRIRMGG
jgi:hypothetical protein